MTRLRKDLYWDKIVDYYYDNVHYTLEKPPSMFTWLADEYNAQTNRESREIEFLNEKDATWFLMRWS